MGTIPTPALSIEQRSLRGLRARSDRKGLIHLASHAGALLCTGALVWLARGTLWLLPALVLHGIVVVFLFAPLHEAIHRTAFESRRLNDWVAWICGSVLVLPPRYFRAFHFAHHRHTQDAARDPELSRPKPRTMWDYVWHISGIPYWRERIGTTLRHACGRVEEPFMAAQQRPRIVREARLVLTQYACVAVVSLALQTNLALWLWLLPALLGQPFLRAYLLAEHTGCPLVADMLENSRTTLTTRLVRWLAWNMPYHAEHHAHPAIPFHGLPAAHAMLKERIAIQGTGYVAVSREIVASLRVRPSS